MTGPSVTNVRDALRAAAARAEAVRKAAVEEAARLRDERAAQTGDQGAPADAPGV